MICSGIYCLPPHPCSCFIRYDAFAYGYALAIVEMPYLFVQSLLFVPIMYWMVSFQVRCCRFGREVQAISLRSWGLHPFISPPQQL